MAIQQKRMTYSEFEQFIAAPENRDRKFELINGEIVEVSPTEFHASIVARITLRIGLFVEQHQSGRIGVEPRHKMPGDDHNAYIPDFAFTSSESALPIVKRGAVPQMPDLAVEVKSPDDNNLALREKAAYYIANGSRMVWLVYPDYELVEIYQPDADVQVLNAKDTIDGGAVLPGFTLAVRDIFDV
jgi:Uma2 family endonuclease